MLQSLRIQNFKGWKDTGDIKMTPLTLFFGVNSSGKSSIGQFLMMLKQTAESPDRKTVLSPGDKNSAVQLGSFQEMVFQRNSENTIEFEYEWDLQDPFSTVDSISGQTYSGNRLSFSAQVGYEEYNQSSPILKFFHYILLDATSAVGQRFLKYGKPILSIHMRCEAGAYKVKSDYKLKRKPGRVWPPGTPIRFYGFPDEVVAHYQNADFVKDMNLHHEKLFRSLYYLGPLRSKAERLYSWTGAEPESVGYSGENTIAAVLAAKDRRINFAPKQPLKRFEELIARNLMKMGLIEKIKVESISKHRQEYEVKIRTKGSAHWVDLPDVGFGISQVLPVLVQCFYAPRNSIILMEQPEIHLHPSAQAALADVMIDAVKSRENGEDRNIQIIIESHSEHFLRRLQRRIAEEVVSENDVSAYFADSTKTPAKLERILIDEYGNIRNWPENFFGDEMGDVNAHALAAMKKRMAFSSGTQSK